MPRETTVDVTKCHACHAKASRATSGDQARHQTQPSVISATPPTQNEGWCCQVPRLPRETPVDVTKCHACHTKWRGVTGDQRGPSTLHYTPLRDTTLRYLPLPFTTLHYNYNHNINYNYTTLHYTHYTSYIELHSTPLHYTQKLHYYTTLHYTTLNCTTLHYTYNYNHNHYYATLHYTTLDYTTLHYPTLHCTRPLNLYKTTAHTLH